jgi:hypothetical protein
VTWLSASDGALRFAERVASGTRAYFDAEWLPSDAARFPALSIESASTRWGDERATVRMPPETDPDAAAYLVFRSLARRAAMQVPAAAGRPEIVGSGLVSQLVAAEVRALASRDGAPAAIIDTTCAQATIAAATSRLAPLGTLVLAGGRYEPIELDLYPDVHSRGLRLVGVPVLDATSATSAAPPAASPSPRAITEGETLPVTTSAWSVLVAS